MKNVKGRTFQEQIWLQNKILYFVLFGMLLYMVVIGELGLGDSRVMTDFAQLTSKILFFGSFGYIVFRIIRNKKLLANYPLLLEQQREILDERRRFLHDKSGGVVMDMYLLISMFVTCTTALWDMTAFSVSCVLFFCAVLLKGISFFIYRKRY